MGRKCAVVGCTDKSSHRHRFPNPKKNISLFKQWIDACGSPTLANLNPDAVYSSQRVCHVHFRKEDHASNMYLQKGTLPMLLLPLPKITLENVTEQIIETEKTFQECVEAEHDYTNNKEVYHWDQPSTASANFSHERTGITEELANIIPCHQNVAYDDWFELFTKYIPHYTAICDVMPISKHCPNSKCGWRVHFRDHKKRPPSKILYNVLLQYIEAHKPRNTEKLILQYNVRFIWSIEYSITYCTCDAGFCKIDDKTFKVDFLYMHEKI